MKIMALNVTAKKRGMMNSLIIRFLLSYLCPRREYLKVGMVNDIFIVFIMTSRYNKMNSASNNRESK